MTSFQLTLWNSDKRSPLDIFHLRSELLPTQCYMCTRGYTILHTMDLTLTLAIFDYFETPTSSHTHTQGCSDCSQIMWGMLRLVPASSETTDWALILIDFDYFYMPPLPTPNPRNTICAVK